jgi:orotate phosphoribosyltransferase
MRAAVGRIIRAADSLTSERNGVRPGPPALEAARAEVQAALHDDALNKGRIKLSSGREADYYIDAKRPLLQPRPFIALGNLVAAEAERLDVSAVGGMTMGADPVAFAAMAAASGKLNAFIVRKERKEHGLQRWVEGPSIEGQRVLVVDDVVTSGKSLIDAIERVREEHAFVAGALAVLDRCAGGEEAIREALGPDAVYIPLFTIDDVYPDRPDR